MEKVTDRDSIYYKIRELISVKTLRKIMEIGMTEAVGKGLQMIRADGR
jgi:hypothetical protein